MLCFFFKKAVQICIISTNKCLWFIENRYNQIFDKSRFYDRVYYFTDLLAGEETQQNSSSDLSELIYLQMCGWVAVNHTKAKSYLNINLNPFTKLKKKQKQNNKI